MSGSRRGSGRDTKGRRQVHDIQWASSFNLGSLSKLADFRGEPAARAL